MVSIGIMGDLNWGFRPQTTIEPALQHAAESLGVSLRSEWVSTEAIQGDPEGSLSSFDALFGAPGTLKSVAGALQGIEFARTRDRVFIGTCGGFQHAVLEYARNVCGLSGAAHQDYDPNASELVLTALPCSLGGRVMRVRIEPRTLASSIFEAEEVAEEYYCNYGINPDYEDTLARGGLVISGRDDDGAPRIIELPKLTFYVASLFVPQTASHPDRPHPLIAAFVRAAHARTSVALQSAVSNAVAI